jgi:hypothetical protein
VLHKYKTSLKCSTVTFKELTKAFKNPLENKYYSFMRIADIT